MILRIASSLAALVLATNAFGAPKLPHGMRGLFDALKSEAGKNPARKSPLRQPKQGECTDFSGTWRGSCTTPDETYDDEFVLEQEGCETIYLGSFSLNFGGITTYGNAAPSDFASNATFMPKWGPSLNSFSFYFDMNGRSLAEEMFLFFRGTNDFSIVEGKLVTRSQYETRLVYGGNTHDGKNWDECTYDKVAK